MNRLVLRFIFLLALVHHASGQELPALFKGILPADQPTRAEVVAVLPPPEIEKYVAKVEQNAAKDPKWFAEHAKAAKPGVPLPFHEKLGLTKEEYDAYIALWNKREYKVVKEVSLILRQGSDKRWNIFTVGPAAALSSLRFAPEDDTWKSANGTLKRLADIKADPMSTLGAWTGKEWKFQEETMLSRIKENFAIGETGEGKYTLLVYRAQEITTEGTRLLDKSLIVRLPKSTATVVKPLKKP